MHHFVVIGGGLAGHRATLELRRLAPEARITLICEEAGLPYDRPPLSKELLLGTRQAQEVALADPDSYAALNIRHVTGQRATQIDRARHVVLTADGQEHPYDRLLLATGSRPRRLAAAEDAAPVFYLRTLDDALRLRAELGPGRHLAIIGGGFIGLEVAAAARLLGCQVTVLEGSERILSRGMPPCVSDWVQAEHARQGVEIRLAAAVASIERSGSGVLISGPDLALRADLVLIGIGVQPNDELAAAAGLRVENGLLVDEACRSSDPAIFGAGEVTCHPVRPFGRRRVESWKSSGEHGAVAARAMVGQDVVFDEVPWLWSDQYDNNIQTVGFPDLAARLELRGDPQSRAWSLTGFDADGSIIGGVAINRGRDASLLRRAIRDGAAGARRVVLS